MILNIKYAERDFPNKIRDDLEANLSIIEGISNLELGLEDKMAFVWEIYKHLYNQYRFVYKDDKELMLKFFDNELWSDNGIFVNK